LFFKDRCPFCRAHVYFDGILDLNVCYSCGARQSARGWMQAGPVIYFTYSFVCPLCEETITDTTPILVNSREKIPHEIANRNQTCRACGEWLVGLRLSPVVKES
jgi:hypothetical protein